MQLSNDRPMPTWVLSDVKRNLTNIYNKPVPTFWVGHRRLTMSVVQLFPQKSLWYLVPGSVSPHCPLYYQSFTGTSGLMSEPTSDHATIWHWAAWSRWLCHSTTHLWSDAGTLCTLSCSNVDGQACLWNFEHNKVWIMLSLWENSNPTNTRSTSLTTSSVDGE